jgi:hypothetical protein
VLLALFAIAVGSVDSKKTNSQKEQPAAELSLAFSKQDSENKEFFALIEEERLFSEKPTTVVFSSADTPNTVHLNCTIHCEREGS